MKRHRHHTNSFKSKHLVGTGLQLQNLAQNVLEEMNFSMLLIDQSCNILVKNVALFFPCTRCLPEAKVKIFELIALTKNLKTT